jgi:hypothetical protein
MVLSFMPEIGKTPRIPSLRRVLLSSEGGTDLPLALGGISPLPEPDAIRAPQEIEDRKGEMRRVTKRLLAIIEEHRIAALRVDFSLDIASLGIVLDALVAETRREDPAPLLAAGGEIGSYVLTALYEELLAEPSNILHTTHIAADVVRYEAMDAAFWAECLAALRQKLNSSS